MTDNDKLMMLLLSSLKEFNKDLEELNKILTNKKRL